MDPRFKPEEDKPATKDDKPESDDQFVTAGLGAYDITTGQHKV